MEFIVTLMVPSGLNVTRASHPTTLPAQKIPHQSENTLAHLWNVKKTRSHFSFTFNFFFFCFKMSGGGKKKRMPKHKKEGDGDAGHKRGSSHKGGDLNSWKESDMQNAWDEYTE